MIALQNSQNNGRGQTSPRNRHRSVDRENVIPNSIHEEFNDGHRDRNSNSQSRSPLRS